MLTSTISLQNKIYTAHEKVSGIHNLMHNTITETDIPSSGQISSVSKKGPRTLPVAVIVLTGVETLVEIGLFYRKQLYNVLTSE